MFGKLFFVVVVLLCSVCAEHKPTRAAPTLTRVETNHMFTEFLHPSCVCVCMIWTSGRLCGSHGGG